jgi:Concanavalin A-like lectin/glucanases superfamily/Bacterial Ig domain/Secretion system C-terminal sorting domain/Kazal-type serine protease inhibitor domain/Pregnancy-associated plasma protein-A/SprB repeat
VDDNIFSFIKTALSMKTLKSTLNQFACNSFLIKLMLVIFIGISQYPLLAQNECGTTVPENWLFPHQEFANFRNQVANSAEQAMDSIPIKAHVAKNSDGSGSLTEHQVMVAIVALNERFANTGMQFFLCKSIDYIDNDDIFNFESSNENLILPYQSDKALNVYFVNSVKVNNKEVCGYTYLPYTGPRLIILDNICALNTTTFAHEMGHYWGLLHTFGKGNDKTKSKELVNGSNCRTEGDMLCSTPADPGVDDSNVNEDCQYFGTKLDTNLQLYRPDVSNLMSYAPYMCRRNFTSEQAALMRMNYSIHGMNLSNSNCQNCNAPSDLKVSEVASSTATLHCAKMPNAISYHWQVKAIGSTEWTNLGTTTVNVYSITDPILDRSTKYTFRVKVTYQNGGCDLWTTKDFNTDACRLPGIQGNSSEVRLDYTSIVNDTFKWRVCREDGSDCREFITTTPRLDLTNLGLSPDSFYYVQGQIKCLDGYGEGGWSHKFRFNQACKKAHSLIFEPHSSLNILFVTSDIFPNIPSNNISDVEIQYHELGDSTWTSVRNGSGSFMLQNFIIRNKTYEFRVRHKCVSGYFTDWSDIHLFSDELLSSRKPIVSITSPTDNSSFNPPANIVINATATVIEGTITKVQFVKEGVSLIGTDTSAPYSFSWQNVPIGTYTITAKATDNRGRVTTSSPIKINVVRSCSSFKFDDSIRITIGVYYPCDEKPYTAPVIGGQPPYRYKWSNGSTETYIPGNQPGTYTVTVTDANNCSISKTIEVPVVEKPVVSAQANQAGGCTTLGGSATANVSKGKAPYSYLWSNDQNTSNLTNVAAGNYSLTVYDNQGCRVETTVSIPLKTPMLSISNVQTNQVTASWSNIDLSTNSYLEYRIEGQSNWMTIAVGTNTTRVLTGLQAATNYDMRIAAGCAISNTESVSQISKFRTLNIVNTPPLVFITSPTSNNAAYIAPATITINATATDTDGSINRVEFYSGSTLLGTDNTAPYQFTWQNVAAGTYTLTARAIDNLGALTSSPSIIILVNQPIVCSAIVDITTTPKCPVVSSTITATVMQGTAPFSYRWNTGSTTQTLTNVAFGTYTVTVTDSRGCIGIKSITTGPVYCVGVYDPVCGSDGKTYSNSCYAECAGVTWTRGECVQRDPNLLLYLPFTGNANDASGNNFHGNVLGAQLTTDRLGRANSAYTFNGTTNYISIADNNLLDIRTADYTMSFWIKTTATTPGRIISKGSSGCTTGFMVRTGGPNASRIHLENAALGNCRVNYFGNKVINDGVWHCVVCIVQRNGWASIYVDGVLDKQIQLNTAGLDLSNNLNLTLGVSHVTGLPEWFRGSLDEIRLYSKAVSNQEISNLCSLSAPPPMPSPTPMPIGVSIFPNPTKANSILNISFETANEDDIHIDIEDLAGRKVITRQETAFKGSNLYKIEIPTLNPSIYVVRLQQGKDVFIRKLIVL